MWSLLAAGRLACLSTHSLRERGFEVQQHADVSKVHHEAECKAPFKKMK